MFHAEASQGKVVPQGTCISIIISQDGFPQTSNEWACSTLLQISLPTKSNAPFFFSSGAKECLTQKVKFGLSTSTFAHPTPFTSPTYTESSSACWSQPSGNVTITKTVRQALCKIGNKLQYVRNINFNIIRSGIISIFLHKTMLWRIISPYRFIIYKLPWPVLTVERWDTNLFYYHYQQQQRRTAPPTHKAAV